MRKPVENEIPLANEKAGVHGLQLLKMPVDRTQTLNDFRSTTEDGKQIREHSYLKSAKKSEKGIRDRTLVDLYLKKVESDLTPEHEHLINNTHYNIGLRIRRGNTQTPKTNEFENIYILYTPALSRQSCNTIGIVRKQSHRKTISLCK